MPNNDVHVNKLSEDTKKSMASRIAMAIIIVLIVLPSVLIGDYLLFALVLFVLCISGYELIRTTKASYKSDFKIYIATLFSTAIPFILTPILTNMELGAPVYDLVHGFSSFRFISFFIFLIFISNFLIVLTDKNFSISLAFYFISMEIFIYLGSLSIMYLRNIPLLKPLDAANVGTNVYDAFVGLDSRLFFSALLLIYIAMGAILNDVFAYFVGVLFGKHKMCPNISPKKTWEGFFGGVILSTLFTFSIALSLSASSLPLFQTFTFDRWYIYLIISLIAPLLGTVGDLIFSSIKRHFGIKDFGTLLGAHGGILDRMDSLYITFIFATTIIELVVAFI